MAWRPGRLDWALFALLWALALAAKLPLLHAPPYGDESLFYYAAAHPGQPPAGVSFPDGSPVFYPTSLVWERPAFYALLWLPAQFGFAAFRVAHAAVASLLAPLAYALLRAHAARRPAALLAGVAVAMVPPLVVWGTYGLTDCVMTLWLGGALWARREGRHGAAAVLLLLAIWSKETAYAAALLLFAFDWFARDRAPGERPRLWPLRIDARLSATAWPLAVGLLPFLYAISRGFPAPGPSDMPFRAGVLDELFLSAWLLPVLLAGLAWPRSRPLAATGLLAGGVLAALNAVAHFSVQAWYEVPTAFLALVGAAAAADAGLASTRRRAVGWLPAAVALVVLAGLVLVPAGSARALLRPAGGDPGNSLTGSYDYELRIRDRDLLAAYAAMPLDGRHDVVAVDLFHAHLYTLAPRTRHLWAAPTGYAPLVPWLAAPLAHRMEANRTWTLVAKQDSRFNQAVRAAYRDCLVLETPGYAVYAAAACPGRAQVLEAAATASP